MHRTTPTTRTLNKRRTLGAVMVETVLVMPFIVLAIALIVYLGWNFRRLAQVTNMDRYSVWESVTPGAPGPNAQHLEQDMRNPKLNQAFFSLNSDLATELNERDHYNAYLPEGHRDLRDSRADAAYAYFDEFLSRSPRGTHHRFIAKHPQSVNTDLLGLSETARNQHGHSRVNGDWRYVNGIAYNNDHQAWEPRHRMVSPGGALHKVFFAELVDGLEPYANNGNELASAIRDFYLNYPSYEGPYFDTEADLPDSSLFD